MGCQQSSVKYEAVSRSKLRKQHMKDAIVNGEAFAVAHYNYAKSLEEMGFALKDFAHFEFLNLESSSDGEHDVVGESDRGDGAPVFRGGASSAAPFPYVFPDLNSHFEKASESAMEVWKISGLLVDKQGHKSNSGFGKLLRSFSHSLRRSRPDNNALIPRDDFNLEESDIHPPVLSLMFEWENRLYDQVEAHEDMQAEYHKQLYILNKLQREKTDLATFEKKKEVVTNLRKEYEIEENHLKSAIQSINNLRDEKLFPKLFQLVQGMVTMWQTMKDQHESQLNIATMLKDNMKLSPSKTETTEQHRKSTNMLLETVKKWDRQYSKLVESQKAFIKALEKWLELSVILFAVGLDGKVFFPTSVEHPLLKGCSLFGRTNLGLRKNLELRLQEHLLVILLKS
ncbi:hypothetical protein PTKIN_Ptkin04bG0227200 [Pterospermum kingtungense]